jgi:class 3 adenylate cyclase
MITRRRVAETFLFADLTGASSSLYAEVRALAREYGGEQIEATGDSLTIRVPRAGDALRLAIRVAQEASGRPDPPPVRLGLHTGHAVVNLAERVAELAAVGEVLLTGATRSAAADDPGGVDFVEFVPRDWVRLKNVRQPVELWAAVPLHRRSPRPGDS